VARHVESPMGLLIRGVLLLGVLALCVTLVATHGVRGFGLLLVLALMATVPRTRLWQFIERPLVRLTGSRARAIGIILFVMLATGAAVNLYGLIRSGH